MKRDESRWQKFCETYVDLIAEYESTPNTYPLNICKFDIMNKIKAMQKISKGVDFNYVLKTALQMSIKFEQSVLDSLSSIINQYIQDQHDINITQAYFNEVNQIYRKNKNDYNIEYCEENRDRLIEMNLKTVISIAKKYQGLGLSLPELISAGNYGLCVAWEKFDPHKAKLKDETLAAMEGLPDPVTKAELWDAWSGIFTYGNLKAKFDDFFKDSSTYTIKEVRDWVDRNVFSAKFNSIATLWIRAFLLIEIDNHSRLVKKPKSEIYKDKALTGSYQKETVLDLDQPITHNTDTTFADTLGMEDDTESELNVREAYDTYKSGMKKLMEGLDSRTRAIICYKHAIGIPRALSPAEISEIEGISLARISQLYVNGIKKCRANAERYNIDPSELFRAVSKFR